MFTIPNTLSRLIQVTSGLNSKASHLKLRTESSSQAGSFLVRGASGVILFCHGNAGNISHRLESIEIFHRLGLNVFIFDYRGYVACPQ